MLERRDNPVVVGFTEKEGANRSSSSRQRAASRGSLSDDRWVVAKSRCFGKLISSSVSFSLSFYPTICCRYPNSSSSSSSSNKKTSRAVSSTTLSRRPGRRSPTRVPTRGFPSRLLSASIVPMPHRPFDVFVITRVVRRPNRRRHRRRRRRRRRRGCSPFSSFGHLNRPGVVAVSIHRGSRVETTLAGRYALAVIFRQNEISALLFVAVTDARSFQ